MREPSLKARVLRYRILQCFQNLHRAWLLGFSLCSNRLSHGRCRTGHKGHKTVFYCSESDRKHAHMNIVNTACAPESCSKQSSSSIGSKFTRSRTLISPLGLSWATVLRSLYTPEFSATVRIPGPAAGLLGASWDVVRKVISTSIGVTKSDDPLSTPKPSQKLYNFHGNIAMLQPTLPCGLDPTRPMVAYSRLHRVWIPSFFGCV